MDDHARYHSPWVGKGGGQLYGEPHTWSLLAARSRKSGYAPVGTCCFCCDHEAFVVQ
jgi:hypothetical protein